MHVAGRPASLERSFGALALVVGRGVACAASALPRVVRRASGLEDPSPEATVAGVVRGVTALAPRAIGGVGGAGLELAGAGAVLAIASFVLVDASESGTRETMLVDAVARAEERGLCSGRTASCWRAMIALAHRDRMLVEHEAVQLTAGVVRSLSPESIGLRLARAVIARQILAGGRDVPEALRVGLRAIGHGLAVGNAWRAMGEAARLVDGMRALAVESVPESEPGAVVIRLPSRAA